MKLGKFFLYGFTAPLVATRIGTCSGSTERTEDSGSKYITFPLSGQYKIIHFVRHAEGEHNAAAKLDRLAYLRQDLHDPHITITGRQQCLLLQKKMLQHGVSADLLVVSPMNRTMETATLSFPHLLGNIPWIAVEHIRERTGLHPCDKRGTVEDYKKQFPHIDFSNLSSNQDPLYDKYILREPEEAIIARIYKFLQWLESRPEREVIVVSHDGYLSTLFSRAIKNVADDGKAFVKFDNCECRSVVMVFPENGSRQF